MKVNFEHTDDVGLSAFQLAEIKGELDIIAASLRTKWLLKAPLYTPLSKQDRQTNNL